MLRAVILLMVVVEAVIGPHELSILVVEELHGLMIVDELNKRLAAGVHVLLLRHELLTLMPFFEHVHKLPGRLLQVLHVERVVLGRRRRGQTWLLRHILYFGGGFLARIDGVDGRLALLDPVLLSDLVEVEVFFLATELIAYRLLFELLFFFSSTGRVVVEALVLHKLLMVRNPRLDTVELLCLVQQEGAVLGRLRYMACVRRVIGGVPELISHALMSEQLEIGPLLRSLRYAIALFLQFGVFL